MTSYRFVTLTCDKCGEISDESERLIREARRVARHQGWTFEDGEDRCPRHNGYRWSAGFGWTKLEERGIASSEMVHCCPDCGEPIRPKDATARANYSSVWSHEKCYDERDPVRKL